MRCEIIAEFASNWGGDRVVLGRMLAEAVTARADRIKTQSYQVKHLDRSDPQYDWLKAAELSDADHRWILEACQRNGMGYMTTVYHRERVPFLATLGLNAIKVGSGELSNAPLLMAIARYPWRVYLSTGLATHSEMADALSILRRHRVTLMHTVSEYPTPDAHVNLDRMTMLDREFCLPTGYSDHTAGITAPLAAIGRGAKAIEVHYCAGGDVPRRSAWDKDLEDLSTLVLFRDKVAEMNAPGRMFWREGEARPFVGRWQHEPVV